jgi:hypothetical protein
MRKSSFRLHRVSLKLRLKLKQKVFVVQSYTFIDSILAPESKQTEQKLAQKLDSGAVDEKVKLSTAPSEPQAPSKIEITSKGKCMKSLLIF